MHYDHVDIMRWKRLSSLLHERQRLRYVIWLAQTEISREDKVNTMAAAAFMTTSSNENIFRVTGPLCGEFTGHGEFPSQRPVTRSFNLFFDLRLVERLGKQMKRRWFETLLCPLWRHCSVGIYYAGSTSPYLPRRRISTAISNNDGNMQIHVHVSWYKFCSLRIALALYMWDITPRRKNWAMIYLLCPIRMAISRYILSAMSS